MEFIMEDFGDWLSIVDYSQKTGVSISTLRRRIKANKIKYQEIGGKYFIYCESKINNEAEKNYQQDTFMLRLEIERLKKIISHQREQLDDLRMLVDLYEYQNKSERPSLIAEDLPPELPLM